MRDKLSPIGQGPFRMRNSDPAMSPKIPRQFFEDHCHGTDVGESGEAEAETDESAKQDPAGICGQRQDSGGQHEQARIYPGFRAAFENCDLPLAGFE